MNLLKRKIRTGLKHSAKTLRDLIWTVSQRLTCVSTWSLGWGKVWGGRRSFRPRVLAGSTTGDKNQSLQLPLSGILLEMRSTGCTAEPSTGQFQSGTAAPKPWLPAACPGGQPPLAPRLTGWVPVSEQMPCTHHFLDSSSFYSIKVSQNKLRHNHTPQLSWTKLPGLAS